MADYCAITQAVYLSSGSAGAWSGSEPAKKKQKGNKKAQRKQRQREEREQKERKEKNLEHDDMTSPQGSPEKEKKKDVEGEKESYYQSSIPPKNIWIIKPGENTNQGKGI